MPKIKDIPKFDRPREKFLEKGPDALTDSELLAILLGSGIKGTNVKVLSQKIIKKFGDNLLNVSVADLMKISGIGQAKALQISSALALTGRIFNKQNSLDNLILSAQDAINLVLDLKDKKQEHLICLYLNARNALIKKETISIGTLDKSIIHPREIFAPGLEMHAAGVILIHNHPSGDPKPSEQDKQVAKRIIEAGQLMGVNVIDFLIVAKNGVHSILGDLKNVELTNTEYVAEGSQASLFDLLVDANQLYFYNNSMAKNKKKSDNLRFIDLFAGIGGFHIAFHNAGAECVFVSEWDGPAQKTYRHNLYKISPEMFDSGNFIGDITKIKTKDIPDFDILTAGFPCQPFSQAGFKKGFSETRGTLFFDIVKIIKEKKPKAFFLENVRGLLSHDDGKTFKTIERVITKELGYSFFPQIVRASDFGLPQHRPRLFMVGFKDTSIDFKFPEPIKELKYTLSDIFNGKCDKEIGFTLRVGGRGSKITDRRNWDAYRVNGKIVQLGPKEGLKMQGFPDWYEFPPNFSSVQAMKQLGNSVAVPAIQAVAEEIVKTLKKYGNRK
ncbi:MAG: DNA repair protein RadC [Candidatus Moranbacteria bacterium]|nr:DNA repair protein RadC [Candidatus Moranbacteria bacterium]